MGLTKNVNGIDIPLTASEESDIIKEWESNKLALAAIAYRLERAAAYPAITDQLDAMWKILHANPNLLAPTDAQAISDQIQQVKALYPKPIANN